MTELVSKLKRSPEGSKPSKSRNLQQRRWAISYCYDGGQRFRGFAIYQSPQRFLLPMGDPPAASRFGLAALSKALQQARSSHRDPGFSAAVLWRASAADKHRCEEVSAMTAIFSPFREPGLMSARTTSYVEALIREGDNFDYDGWLKRVRQEEADANQRCTTSSFSQAVAKTGNPVAASDLGCGADGENRAGAKDHSPIGPGRERGNFKRSIETMALEGPSCMGRVSDSSRSRRRL